MPVKTITGCLQEFLKKIFYKCNEIKHLFGHAECFVQVPEKMGCMRTKQFYVREFHDFPKSALHQPSGHFEAVSKTPLSNLDDDYSSVGKIVLLAFLVFFSLCFFISRYY